MATPADHAVRPPAHVAVEWHVASTRDVLAQVHGNESGLSSAEAAERLRQSGANVIPSQAPPGAIVIALRQLRSPLIYVLLAAAIVALAIGEFTDAGFIAVVLVTNSAIGGWQEWRAEQQRHGLQQLLQARASVLRDGQLIEVDASAVVCGDVVMLESGQRVPADLRLLQTNGLEIDEALLTGESFAVAKEAAWVGTPATALSERRCMAYAGSSVTRGRGHGVVVATAGATVVGSLAAAIRSVDAGAPPLVERMQQFSRSIAIAVLGAAIVIGVVAVLVHHQPVAAMFLAGVALAVSAIPEGLPVAITIALAVGARRMASRGAIVRRLPAVEGLGSCTLIASDKTGTLTCNELTAREVIVAEGTRFTVSGAGYAPAGDIRPLVDEPSATATRQLQCMLEIAAACNEAALVESDATWRCRGDPTDVALLSLAYKGGVERAAWLVRHPVIEAIPFEPEQRFAASIHARDGSAWIAVKGAPERVLEMCALGPADLQQARAVAATMASRGQRVLALADGACPIPATAGRALDRLAGLRLQGFIGLIDPLRPEAAAAVRRCLAAGVRVVMVTGDHPATALAIARELGIANNAAEVVEGSALSAAGAETPSAFVATGRVYARVTPDQKLAIVRAAQEAGHFVAVTGDGVNDAPALRHANIGVAMGRGGTDVARDAADMVLSDDNFATIVAGIEEGRVAYQNIRNVIYLVVAAGVAEVLTVGLAVLANLPLPLLPAQLLWLNLVTNGIQDVSLAFERKRGDELTQPPRRPDEPVFNRLMLERVLLGGAWMALLGLGAFVWMLRVGVPLTDARNALMLLMVLMQNVDVFNARSETLSAFRVPLVRNPALVLGVTAALSLHVFAMQFAPLGRVLQFAPLPAEYWLAIGAAALSLLLVMELHKASWCWRTRAAATGVE